MTEPSTLVLIGFVDQPIDDEMSIDWCTNKIGGKPKFPSSIDDSVLSRLVSDELVCSNCSKLFSLICQIQCSVDDRPALRMIYIFACLQEGCTQFFVVRLMFQPPSISNKATTKKYQIWSCDSDWSDGDAEDDGSISKFTTDDINQSNYGTSEDAFSKGKFAPMCFGESINLLPFHIYVENSDYLKSSQSYLTAKELKSSEFQDLTNEDGEKYENPEVSTIFSNDKIAYKFYKNLRDFPKQIIRYSWQGQPLLNSSNANFKVDDCENCGCARQFEFQLMPGLISRLKTSPTSSSYNLDFGTVLIYCCSNNCDSKTLNVEKFIFLEEVDSNVINERISSRN